MDSGEIAILAAISIGFAANLIAISRSGGSRAAICTVRCASRVSTFWERISDAKRERAHLEVAKGVPSDALMQQSHTHEASAE